MSLTVCLSVCLSVTNLASSLFLGGIEPFFGHQFSMTKTTKLFSLIFDLCPLTPKIYSPKFHLWVTESVIVCGSTTFGLGAEIQSLTGLFINLRTDNRCFTLF